MPASTNPPEPDLRYPVGRFEAPAAIGASDREAWLREVENLPRNLRNAVAGLNEARLDTTYRPGGWTVRQVVHHVADSHLNSYIRFRLAMTEDTPAIKVYDEAAWAKLPDARSAPVDVSLDLIAPLHTRWTLLLRSFTDHDWARELHHPEMGTRRLDWMLGLYAWHCRHHVAHITSLRDREGW